MSRYKKHEDEFKSHFNLTDQDLSYLWELFMTYGMNGRMIDCTKGNHYFLQGICQYQSVEFKTWGKKLSKPVLDIITEKYPQLMVQEKQFEC